jgi:glycosyltransferase involved in cell wall biosynthesis
MVFDRCRKQDISSVPGAAQIVNLAEHSRIALYQGIIRPDRDLSQVCRVFAKMWPHWSLILMGKDYGHLETLRSIHPRLIHVPHIPAPEHLKVTSWASIGVVVYNHDCLNNLYCAPSKIYEYGAFGVPVLANDVPGLQNTVGTVEAGVCCDTADERSIKDALTALISGHATFSANATRMYESVARADTELAVADALIHATA